MRVMAGEFSRAIGRILEPYNPESHSYRMSDITVINTHMSAVGLNMSSYFEAKFAIDSLRQFHTILRGNLATDQFRPSFVNPANMFAGDNGKETQYYESVLEVLKSPDHSAYTSLIIDFGESDDDSTDVYRLASEGIPSKQKKKRTKKPANNEAKIAISDVVTAAKTMNPQLRAAIANKIGELLNCHPLIIAQGMFGDSFNIYIGQFGFAPFITPVQHGGSPSLYIYLTTGEFRDPSIYHLHPAGKFHLKSVNTEHLLANVIKPLIAKKPREESVSPVGFGFVVNPSWDTITIHIHVIKFIAKTIAEHVQHISLPIDAKMLVWKTFTSVEVAEI
jgi:hypothetical protein